MEDCIEFEVTGHPQPKERAAGKGTNSKGKAVRFTPQKTRDFEAKVAACFLESGNENRTLARIWSGSPLTVKMFFVFGSKKTLLLSYLNVPHDGYLKSIFRLFVPKSTKPDVDNCVKSILDGLNGFAYPDDNVVSEILAKKVFKKGAAESTLVKIQKCEDGGLPSWW